MNISGNKFAFENFMADDFSGDGIISHGNTCKIINRGINPSVNCL